MTSFQQQIAASLDDDEANSLSHSPTVGNARFGKLSVGKVFYAWHSFLRFSLAEIPIGSTITSAILTLVAYSSRTDDFIAQINITNESDALDFTNSPFAQADGGTDVAWTVPDFVAEQQVQTVDISSLIQTFVNLPNHDHVAIRIKHGDAANSEYQNFYQYDGSSAKAAILTITYTAPSGQQLFTLINQEDY